MPSVLPVDAHAQQVALADAIAPAGAHDLVVLIGAPCRRQQHHEGEVGGALGQHARRVRHHDAARLGRGDVDMVVADAAGCADADAVGQLRDRLGRQRQRVGEQKRLGAMRGCGFDDFGHRHVVLAIGHNGIELLSRPRHHVARHEGSEHEA